MDNKSTILIGFSSKFHEPLINDFKQGLPIEIIVEDYLQDRYYSADASSTFYPLVIGFSEWLLSNSGSYVLNLILDKVRSLIKGHLKEYNNKSSFKLLVKKGENIDYIEVDNVSEELAMKALDEFINRNKQ